MNRLDFAASAEVCLHTSEVSVRMQALMDVLANELEAVGFAMESQLPGASFSLTRGHRRWLGFNAFDPLTDSRLRITADLQLLWPGLKSAIGTVELQIFAHLRGIASIAANTSLTALPVSTVCIEWASLTTDVFDTTVVQRLDGELGPDFGEGSRGSCAHFCQQLTHAMAP